MDTEAKVVLWWIPLGAGGHFVRTNGRIYEALAAWSQHRPRRELYHTALEVHKDGKRFVVENAWPIPDRDPAKRGVVVEGPVFHHRFRRLRFLRYEVRCWTDGTIYDVKWAVGGPQVVSQSAAVAQRVVELTRSVPDHVWGRRVAGTDEMWNSNSVISWLLTKAGVDVDAIGMPPKGRAPGWQSGINLARAAGQPR